MVVDNHMKLFNASLEKHLAEYLEVVHTVDIAKLLALKNRVHNLNMKHFQFIKHRFGLDQEIHFRGERVLSYSSSEGAWVEYWREGVII